MTLEEYQKGDTALMNDEVVEVINVIADRKATYNSEIQVVTGFNKQKVGQILADLRELEIIETLNPKLKHSDTRLLSRVPDFWERGKTGQEAFGKPNWVGLNSNIKWRLVSKDKLRSDAYHIVDEYHKLRNYVISTEGDYKPVALANDEPISSFVSQRYKEDG